jgi:hypothetical protein
MNFKTVQSNVSVALNTLKNDVDLHAKPLTCVNKGSSCIGKLHSELMLQQCCFVIFFSISKCGSVKGFEYIRLWSTFFKWYGYEYYLFLRIFLDF